MNRNHLMIEAGALILFFAVVVNLDVASPVGAAVANVIDYPAAALMSISIIASAIVVAFASQAAMEIYRRDKKHCKNAGERNSKKIPVKNIPSGVQRSQPPPAPLADKQAALSIIPYVPFWTRVRLAFSRGRVKTAIKTTAKTLVKTQAISTANSESAQRAQQTLEVEIKLAHLNKELSKSMKEL